VQVQGEAPKKEECMSILFDNLVKEIQAADNRPRKAAIETAKDMVYGRVPVSLNFWYVNGKAIIEALEKVLDYIAEIERDTRGWNWSYDRLRDRYNM
jgi:hypothetical protein